ncbi:MAG: succinate dehydrogenase / fumarate reductase iron-sulfur subunit [Planctomycetota bacterium]|jgi:succinate dehydrogenase / fumarate reductase iron-sulfur subunit
MSAQEYPETIHVKLHLWRQKSADDPGAFEMIDMPSVSTHMSFLEMIDVANSMIEDNGGEAVCFDHDCREGICGMCSMVINGQVHGPIPKITTCQLHMRSFNDGDEIYVEPFRAAGFPIVRDLVIDRSALDQIIMAGGFVSVGTGSPQDANATAIPKLNADLAMDAAACIGCGGCVAACPNASAMLFTGAKVSQLALLPQGQPERASRVLGMVEAMDALGFGNCTNEFECMAACPKGIDVSNIARMNREYLLASIASHEGA